MFYANANTRSIASLIGSATPAWDALISAASPVIWLKHDDTSGTTASNSGSYSVDGVYTNGVTLDQAPLITGSGRAALYAVDDHTLITPTSAGDMRFDQTTFEVVCEMTNTNTMAISHTGNTNAVNTAGWLWLLIGGEMRCTAYAGGAWRDVYSVGADLTAGVTTHLAMVCDTTAQKVHFYQNGTLLNSEDWTWGSPALVGTDPLAIGAYMTGAGDTNTFEGTMDDYMLYDQALSTETILAHYNAITAPASEAWDDMISATSPFIWLKQDEISGTTATNAGSYANDGTYYGAFTNPTLNQVPLIAGTDGRAVSYDGLDQCITVAQASANDMQHDEWTAEWVVQFDALTDKDSLAHTGDGATPTQDGWMVRWRTGGEIELQLYDGSSWQTWATSGAGVTTGVTYHIAVTYDLPNNAIKIFVDGVRLANATYTGVANSCASHDLKVWASEQAVGIDRALEGTGDDFVYWDSVFPEATIYSHAQTALTGSVPSSEAWVNEANDLGAVLVLDFQSGTTGTNRSLVSGAANASVQTDITETAPPGNMAGAVGLNGSSSVMSVPSYAACADLAANTSYFSVEMIIKVPPVSGVTESLCSKGPKATGSGKAGWFMYYNTSSFGGAYPALWMGREATQDVRRGNVALPADTYCHIVMVGYNGSGGSPRYFFNGVDSGTTVVSSPSGAQTETETEDFLLGANMSQPGGTPGNLSQQECAGVALYDYALTEAQAAALATAAGII